MYKSLPQEVDFNTMVGLVLERDSGDCPEDLVDEAFEMLAVMFPVWWNRKVRNEMNTLRKSYRGMTIKCEKCGCETKDFEIHHIISPYNFGGNEFSNLQFLCKKCHKETFKKGSE